MQAKLDAYDTVKPTKLPISELKIVEPMLKTSKVTTGVTHSEKALSDLTTQVSALAGHVDEIGSKFQQLMSYLEHSSNNKTILAKRRSPANFALPTPRTSNSPGQPPPVIDTGDPAA